MKKTIIVLLLVLSTLFMLTACKEKTPSDPTKPEPSTSDPADADFNLDEVLPAVQKTLKEYSDGTLKEDEANFLPLPEGVKLPEVTSADVLTYGGFLQETGGYLISTPCPDSEYTMNFVIVNLLMDDGKDYQTASVYFEK